MAKMTGARVGGGEQDRFGQDVPWGLKSRSGGARARSRRDARPGGFLVEEVTPFDRLWTRERSRMVDLFLGGVRFCRAWQSAACSLRAGEPVSFRAATSFWMKRTVVGDLIYGDPVEFVRG